MKKLAYLFVMVAGMTLAAVNVNAQDAKGSKTTGTKEVTAACCKSGDKAMCGKAGDKTTASACTKGAGMTSQKETGKTGACCKATAQSTASQKKVSKTVN